MFKSLLKLFPAHARNTECVLCGLPTREEFCAGCYSDLPWNSTACVRCALPLRGDSLNNCSACSKNPVTADYTVAAMRYEFPIDALIRRFKYDEALFLARPLSDLLVTHIQQASLRLPSAILPVPLHSNRLRERGFNQSLEIARILSRKLGIPISSAMQRTRDTRHQSGLNAIQRRKNLRFAFRVRNERLPTSMAIVDDVMTTGTTINMISNQLRRHGVEEIQAWCIARAGGN